MWGEGDIGEGKCMLVKINIFKARGKASEPNTTAGIYVLCRISGSHVKQKKRFSLQDEP